jgi:hypothetical protein
VSTKYTVFAVGALLVPVALTACQTTTVAVPAEHAATQQGSAPVLQSVTMRYNVPAANGVIVSVVPDFHFIDADGDAVLILRELVETSGSKSNLHIPASTPIDISADIQKKGAVVSGGWNCGTAQYYVTLRTHIMDAEGHKSNSLQYTIHCNGG